MKIKNFLSVVLVLLLGLGFSWRLVSTKEVIFPKNKNIKFTATINNEPKISESKQVIKIGDGWIYADLYPGFTAGEKIIVEGRFDDSGKMFSPKIRQVDGKANLGIWDSLRLKFRQNFEALLPAREAALVEGMVLGIDRMDKELKDAFIKTGTIHVVVVSGQNLAIVAGVFLGLVTLIGRRSALVLALTASIFYAFLTGLEPPVVRALLMVMSMTLAIFFGRQTSVLWAIFLAALVILFFWPRAIFDISFQLTFAATLGIATLGRYLANLAGPVMTFNPAYAKASVDKPVSSKDSAVVPLEAKQSGAENLFSRATRNYLINAVLSNAAIATSAFLFTMPIILYHFGRISLVSPFANIVVAEAVFPIMILGFAVAIVSLIFIPLAQLIAYLAFVPAHFFVRVVGLFAGIPFGQMELGKGNLVLVGGCYLILVLSLLIWMRRGINN